MSDTLPSHRYGLGSQTIYYSKRGVPLTAKEYQDWMARAFLLVESALAAEFATPARITMTEEYIRASFVRGLILSMPDHASRVRTEHSVDWSGSSCYNDSDHNPSQGRPIQHDVAVVPDKNDAGMACEVKWLKQAKAEDIAKDIWKLAFSRSTLVEKKALRTYLLVGGVTKHITDSFRPLQKSMINIRWSEAGRKLGIPGPREFPLGLALSKNRSVVFRSWSGLIAWGNPKHFRRCPPTWSILRCTIRNSWRRRLDGVGWAVLLYELDHRGVDDMTKIDWGKVMPRLKFGCDSSSVDLKAK